MSVGDLFAVLHRWEWLAILIARLAVGLVFLLSGRGKLFIPARREEMRGTLEKTGVPAPQPMALFVSLVEFLGGLLLILGFLTPLACIMLSCVMVVALATVKVPAIHAPSRLDWLFEFLYLPDFLYLVIFFWILTSGPGRASLDHLLFR